MTKLVTPEAVDLLKVSISCFDVPDSLLDKTSAKHYFQSFGKVTRIRLRPRQKTCIVEYGDEASALKAMAESGIYNGENFRVAWTKSKTPEKRKSRKTSKDKDPDWPIDPEIQAELEAMKGAFSSSRGYNLRPEAMMVDQIPSSPKKTLALKKTSKSRQWKSEKAKVKSSDTAVSNVNNSEQEAELLKAIMKPALTNEEKFRVLEARDKLLRLRTVRQSELARATKTVGTCPDMCPEKERLMREIQHQVALYEQLGGSKSSMNHVTAVKQYSRSSADQEAPLPHELRPVPVLRLTMGYLLHHIVDLCETPDVNLAEWYHFVWDRTRGIRKDVTQQELCCLGSVELVEQCARFHVHCAARLVAEDVSVFDARINTENLTKCLQTLKYMYHDLRTQQGVRCPNESEFRAYIVLLNLNDGNFMWEVQNLYREIQQSPEVRFAISVYSALDKNNYARFFKLVKSTTYLNACILLRYFNQVRYHALLTIIKSYSPRQPYTQYPVGELRNLMAFEDLDNTVAFLEYHGLQVNAEKTYVLLDRRGFCRSDMPFALERAINVVESKRTCSVGEIICGTLLPEKEFEKHTPHNSFEDNGYLKVEEIPQEFQTKYQQYLTKFPMDETQSDIPPSLYTAENSTGAVAESSREFTFSSPAVEPFQNKSTDFSLPKVATNFIFQLPTTVPERQENSEPDGEILKFKSSESDKEIQTFVSQFKANHSSRSQSPLLANNDRSSPSLFERSSIFGNQKIAEDSLKAAEKALEAKCVSFQVVPTSLSSSSSGTSNTASASSPFAPIFSSSSDNTPRATEKSLKDNSDKSERVEPGQSAKTFQFLPSTSGHLNPVSSSSSVASKSASTGFIFSIPGFKSGNQPSSNNSSAAAPFFQFKSITTDIKQKETSNRSPPENLGQQTTAAQVQSTSLRQPQPRFQPQCGLHLLSELQPESQERLEKSSGPAVQRNVAETSQQTPKPQEASEQVARAASLKQDLLEKERKLRADLLRRQKEAEKQRQKQEELKKREDALKETRIKSEVRTLLSRLLDQVQEMHNQDRLKEIASNIQRRKIQKCVARWKNLTRISKKKRKNFFDNPVWISSRSISDEARELYVPSQELTLRSIKRYKLGTSADVPLQPLPTFEKVDVYRTVWKILFEKLCTNNGKLLMDLNLFWKIGVSVPAPSELKKGLTRLEDVLNIVFEWKPQTLGGELMTVSRTGSNNGGSLAYCIKKLSHSEANVNGLLFLAQSPTELTLKRLSKLLKNQKPPGVPLAVLLLSKGPTSAKLQQTLNKLSSKNLISAWEVFTASEPDLQDTLELCLKFLAGNTRGAPPLEMDVLQTCLRSSIGGEFWSKLRGSASLNERLEILLQEPQITIDLLNEALQHLQDILYEEEILHQPNFPEEFRQFLSPNHIYLPCTYEYFPQEWNSKRHVGKIRNIIQSLSLPPFSGGPWPPGNQHQLQEALQNYCSKIFQENSTAIFLKLLNLTLRKLDTFSNLNPESDLKDQIRHLSWTDILELLVEEKISRLQPSSVYGELLTVVYHTTKLKRFKKIAWWYSSPAIKDKIKEVEVEDISEPEILIDDEEEEIDVDKTLIELREEMDTDDKTQIMNELRSFNTLLDDLEESMKIQEKIMAKFQETAMKALKFD